MLTKSKFRNFLSCPNEFWLDTHFPEPAGELSISEQFRREAGYEVEALARRLPIFAARDGFKTEFGKVFETGDLYAKADIVVTNTATGEIEIYEVKSGTKSKEEYQIDLTFQCIVAKQMGFAVKRAFLITVDNSYIFNGNLAAERLLRITDETEYVSAIEQSIAEQIAEALAVPDSAEPDVSLLDYCKANKLACRFLVRKFPNIPEFNVGNIFGAGSKKLNNLLEKEILEVRDIPADFKMTDRQTAIVNTERSGQTLIDAATIRGELEALKYPLNFLDFETFGHAIPQFIGTHAYQQMVFQFSLHTIDEPNGELKHSFHLSRNDGRHPTEEIVGRLHQELDGRIGTILIWSEGFEKHRNTEMGVMYPKYAAFLDAVNENVYDLRNIFSRLLYRHPEFRGRDSIKKVLPVLCPGLSYDEMDIADGQTASIKWYHMATGRGTEAEREKIYQDLSEYCKLDTLAMVEIYKILSEL